MSEKHRCRYWLQKEEEEEKPNSLCAISFEAWVKVEKDLKSLAKTILAVAGLPDGIFSNQKTNLAIFWWVLQWKVLVYFMAIWNILLPFAIFYVWLQIWFIFSRFGMLYQEKSGNPA
jgi:hypothetical protein